MQRKKKEDNRKIKSNSIEYDGIKFKSGLEKYVYRRLVKYGLNPRYESEVFTIWNGIKPTVPFYDIRKVRGKAIRKNHLNMERLEDITYTPDFVFFYNGIKVIIEAKGKENDQFPLRKKLFRAYLETVDYPVIYAEIFTLQQLDEFMEELKKTK